MKDLYIEGAKDTPDIYFDIKRGVLSIHGRSYPENTIEFFSPVFSWLEEFLEKNPDQALMVNIDLYYFNSSSSKILLDLCDILEETASNGRSVVLNWLYDHDDEDSLDFGESLKEDYEAMTFNLSAKNQTS